MLGNQSSCWLLALIVRVGVNICTLASDVINRFPVNSKVCVWCTWCRVWVYFGWVVCECRCLIIPPVRSNALKTCSNWRQDKAVALLYFQFYYTELKKRLGPLDYFCCKLSKCPTLHIGVFLLQRRDSSETITRICRKNGAVVIVIIRSNDDNMVNLERDLDCDLRSAKGTISHDDI